MKPDQRLSLTEQHRLWPPTLLALWLAAKMLGLKYRAQLKLDEDGKKEDE